MEIKKLIELHDYLDICNYRHAFNINMDTPGIASLACDCGKIKDIKPGTHLRVWDDMQYLIRRLPLHVRVALLERYPIQLSNSDLSAMWMWDPKDEIAYEHLQG